MMKFRQSIGFLTLILAVVYAFWIILKVELFCNIIVISEVYIFFGLICIGIILLGYLNGFIESYINKKMESFGIDAEINEKIKTAIEEKITSIKTDIEDIKSDINQTSVEFERNLTDEKSTERFDTVIVNVKDTLEQVKSELKYKCPSSYSFRNDLQFIAFYKEKKIVGYGKITNNNYNDNIGSEKHFLIETFVEKIIPRSEKGALIQNKMYCNIEKLKNAQKTNEIR